MLLITPEQVILHAFAPRERITPAAIRPLKIDIAQEHFIRPRLGDALFDQLVDGLHADFTQAYLAPALAHFVRYGILAELCVEVGDRGALVYSASSDETHAARTQDSSGNQNRQTNQTDTQTTNATHTTTVNDTTNINRTEGLHRTEERAMEGALVDTISDLDDYSNNITERKTDDLIDQTRTTTQKGALVQVDSTEVAVDENRSASGEHYRPATLSEVRGLTVRALADAQILLAKAVRYLARHGEQFADYSPQRLADQVFF